MDDHPRNWDAGQSPVDAPGPISRNGAMARNVERARNPRGVMHRLMDYLRPHRTALVVVILLSTLATALALAGPFLMGRAIDSLAARNTTTLLRMTLLMLGAYVLSASAQMAQGIIVARIAQSAMRILRADLFAHIQTLSLHFFDTRPQGELMSRLTNDMDVISRVLTNNAAQLFTGLLTLFGVVAIMFALDPLLALTSMLIFPMMIGLVGIIGRRTRNSFRRFQACLGDLNAVMEENFSGQRVVIAFGRQQHVLAQFDRTNEAARSAGVRAMSMSLLIMPMMGILSNANIAIVGGVGGWMAIRGMVSIGTIAAFITYSRRFAEPLRQLGDLYNQVQGALAGAERIFETLDTVADQQDPPRAVELARVAGEVRFEHVTFGYEPGVPVLRDVCLHARPGERVALVGHTGAGKTTLVNLLFRFYDFDQGAILIDGIDIRGITRKSLRRHLGVVLQQSFLFSESVLENIRYGRLAASDEEVMAAARLAHADGFIRRLPQGYHTVLAERGGGLSWGQLQLVTIARAILADPAILILDEATSSVDTRTEVKLQQALDGLMKGRTSFVIAHRLSTITHADQVVVIEQGRVVEKGTHPELLAAGGVYHHLYMRQFRRQAELTGCGADTGHH